MKVYHGSKISPEQLRGGLIEPQQATTYEGSNVPESELQRTIYTTPDLGYAIAMAARPDNSNTKINDELHEINFSNPELFDPNQEIYIYEIETDNFPEASVKQIDKWQIDLAVKEGVKPDGVRKMKAKEVMNYYELTNWKKEGEDLKENNLEPPKEWEQGLRR